MCVPMGGRRGALCSTFVSVALSGSTALLLAATDGARRDVPEDTLPAELPRAAPFGLPEFDVPESDTAAAALGRRLFFDPVLSADRTVACASCHDPATGFANASALSVGVHERTTTRNAPTLFNRAYGTSFMWDGRASTLEEQVLQPIVNEVEMDLALPDALARLNAGAYRADFERAFGGPANEERLARSLAAFVRRLFLGNSPVDLFRSGQRDAVTAAERSGFWFYESRGGCWRCHSGPNFSDEGLHNTGIGATDGVPEDGRFAVTNDEKDRGRFKTPTLRGLVFTAPYMHDGSVETLAEVVEHYRKGGHANSHLDEALAPIDMSDADAANLVAFLSALSRTVDDSDAPGSKR